MKRIIFAGIISAVVISQSFGAMLSEGTRRLEVNGRIDETEEFNMTIGGAAGYFVQDNIEIGVLAGYTGTHGGDDMRITAGAYSEYNIVLGESTAVVPYVGVAGGLTYTSRDWGGTDESDTVLEFSVYSGARYFLVENVAIGSAVRFFYATDDIYMSDSGKVDDDFDWDIILSTSFYF
jgi:hypothetical protein